MILPGMGIETPNFPDPYGNNLYCQATLTFDARVSIEFQIFSVDYDYGSHLCEKDWLEVHDGDSQDSDMIGSRLCGNDEPSPINASSNTLTLVFHSDNTSSPYFLGFKIRANQGKLKSIKRQKLKNIKMKIVVLFSSFNIFI